ncbi:MAG TPA: NAD(P)/FAD-dependent oxidoreductase [Stellaceae bacterium]|nr:NAD(P)/FAD-dependent oxidoreductase [Stellaceae bacterium]
MPEIVIVGAGPAGIAAAEVLVERGERPVVLDESRRAGGQGYRTPAPGLALDMGALLGSESGKYRSLHDRFAALRDRVDYRPETLVWNVSEGEVFTLSGDVIHAVRYDALILATGAVDRVMPVRGWQLPGVYTLGGAQVMLKDQGCLIGKRVVFCGSSPLLYLAALQYRMMDAEIAAVLDTTPFAQKLAALPKLAAHPPTMIRGLKYLWKLRQDGVSVRHGARLLDFTGRDGVEGVRYRDAAGAEHSLPCDAVAFGFGLRSETQLADLAGCDLAYDPVFRQFLPKSDADGRCGNGVYVAGDGATIGGADAAELSGRLAGYALLADRGVAVPEEEIARLRSELGRYRRFQQGLATAFAWPSSWAGEIAADVAVCRCEGVTAGMLRKTARAEFGGKEINRAKALTRVGMGRCQGRFCSLAAGEIAAAAIGRPQAEVGRLRGQAPVKPLPMSARLAE